MYVTLKSGGEGKNVLFFLFRFFFCYSVQQPSRDLNSRARTDLEKVTGLAAELTDGTKKR